MQVDCRSNVKDVVRFQVEILDCAVVIQVDIAGRKVVWVLQEKNNKKSVNTNHFNLRDMLVNDGFAYKPVHHVTK